jgi:hypothetical protein
MSAEHDHEAIQLELSVAHDEGRPPSAEAAVHLASCHQCADFAAELDRLDDLLGSGTFDRAPGVASSVVATLNRPRIQWWAVAAIAIVGILAGALVGGFGSRLEVGSASELHDLFRVSGSSLEGLSADLLVVERGLHPDTPERVYTGTIRYTAPEMLSIELADTTLYPSDEWIPNDVSFRTSDGDTLWRAGLRCPVAALPGCLVPATIQALSDQPPFDEGILVPLEIVGPGRSLTQSSGIEVLGEAELEGLATIQVRSTVAAVELIGALTDKGSWREFHPTDVVLMWLDEATLIPVRIEVFAADSAERELWELRRGYSDEDKDDPILIVELTNLRIGPAEVVVELPADAPSRGFLAGKVDLPTPMMDEAFRIHRTGHWQLGGGERVEVSSWSDGRNWLMLEGVRGWTEPRLFGLSSPFAQPLDLGNGSVGYMAPAGDAIAIHSQELDLVISGSLPSDLLLEAARSLGVVGDSVPGEWLQASNVDVMALPAGTLVPQVEGWALSGRVDGEATTILLSGGGARTVLIAQTDGSKLDTPIGPDFVSVDLRGLTGRYNTSTGALEWVEDGHVVKVTSETVGMEELIVIAVSMESN